MDHSLDLYVVDSGSRGKAIVVGRRGTDIAIARIDLGATAKALAAFTDRVESVVTGGGVRPTITELNRVGRDLFDYVFQGDLLNLYNRAASGQINIQLVTDHPLVHRIPWEFLHPSDLPAVPSQNRCVARVLPMCAPPGPGHSKLSGKIRVLLAVADPVNQQGVGWADVEANVRRPLEAQIGPVATLQIVPGASARTLLQALNTGNFDVFHFLGHGTMVNGEGHLSLVDVDSGATESLPATDLAAVLSGQQLRLCILSACLSGAGDIREPFGPVATTLLRAGIPAVVANQTSIPTKSVAPFVGALYARLLRDGNIDSAVMAGRQALHADLRPGIPDGNAVVEWGIPSLFRLPGSGQLFETSRPHDGT